MTAAIILMLIALMVLIIFLVVMIITFVIVRSLTGTDLTKLEVKFRFPVGLSVNTEFEHNSRAGRNV